MSIPPNKWLEEQKHKRLLAAQRAEADRKCAAALAAERIKLVEKERERAAAYNAELKKNEEDLKDTIKYLINLRELYGPLMAEREAAELAARDATHKAFAKQ